MNILEIVVIIIFLALMLDGYRIGLVKTVFSAVKMIISVVLAAAVCLSITGVVSAELRYVVPAVFVSVYGIVMGILSAVERLINIVDKIPVAKQLNRLAGVAGGLLKSVITVWIIFCIIGYFADTSWGAYIYDMFDKSKLLSYINAYNPFKQIVDQWWHTFSAVTSI